MGWADAAIDALLDGNEVTIRPRGKSMEPLIMDGEEVKLIPHDTAVDDILKVGDIVLVRIGTTSKVFLHKILQVEQRGHDIYYQIGNNKGGVNGWVDPGCVFGVKV